VLNDAEDITPDEFWPMVTPDIWSYMPKRHDTEWLLDLCADCVGRENVLICTKSLRHPMHITNKVQWMFANLPHWIQDQYSITSVKHAYARHDVLLIDDSAENTDKFEATRNGRAILVPRPWNRNYRLHPNIYIEERLKDAMMCV
jgi:5'(3')-deoxyribonucleotidase